MSEVEVALRPIHRVSGGTIERLDDHVAVERALEIRVDQRPLAVTLRTPGHDDELALGFLAGEGLIASRADVTELVVRAAACTDQPDEVELSLAPGVHLDWAKLERHFAATAACGLCGRAHLESLRAGLRPQPVAARLDAAALSELPDRLRAAQPTFAATGGLHAAAFCDDDLSVRVVREDVGRHNAVDKNAGWLLQNGRYPAAGGLLWVSGRAGAEIVLKAARAQLPILAAVGAPSSLAIELAEAAGMTLIGFLRNGRMNVYSGVERLLGA
ncbi:MAG TPA: formate dehydrogenase accessory sulfurtransferase FdhD [Candidatus Limnocylindria bacterium]|nr:formate dehydrogenase accessory sulfurtransferase FdhD [Candidatus Limnocylindria bacterium]